MGTTRMSSVHGRASGADLLEDGFHAPRDTAALVDGTKHRGQIAARPEQLALAELVGAGDADVEVELEVAVTFAS